MPTIINYGPETKDTAYGLQERVVITPGDPDCRHYLVDSGARGAYPLHHRWQCTQCDYSCSLPVDIRPYPVRNSWWKKKS